MRPVVAGLAAVIALTCCGGQESGAVVRLSAASSLTELFAELAAAFESEHPGSDVVLTFGGSPALVTQLREGAPTDVLVTADQASMDRAVASGDVGEPVVIARNRLTVVVERGNPRAFSRLDDLARPGVRVALCAPAVPCGRLAGEVLGAAGITVEASSREESVKAVLTKVVLGEVDAGLVYETDARAAGAQVQALSLLPAGEDAPSTAYLAAITTEAAHADLATRWMALLVSPAGRRALDRHGFLPA